MIVRHPDPPEHPDERAAGTAASAVAGVPPAVPDTATVRVLSLPDGNTIELLALPMEEGGNDAVDAATAATDAVRAWVVADAAEVNGPLPHAVVVPLYGCVVAWAAARAAVVGPAARLGQLESAVTDFAALEAELRDAERRATALLDTIDADAERAFATDEWSPVNRRRLTARYREAVALGVRLALLAPAVHAPPVHPPTLSSQLGERLRERSRLAERHECAVARAELAERVTEACSQRVAETCSAGRLATLEWAIVVLLVVQTVLLLVDQLARRGPS